MYGLGNISPSVIDLITPPANDLSGYGDMYVITDTRKRPRKDLTDTKAFERFDIREFNSSEISRLQSEDPLLFEQIKADVNKGLGKPNIKLEFNTNEELADFLKENRKSSGFDNYVDVTASESGTAADRAAATREKIKRAAILPGSGSKTLPGTMSPTPLAPTKTPPPLPPSPTSTAKALPAPKEQTSTPSGNTVKFSPNTKKVVEPIEVVNHGLSITGRSGDPSYINVYWSDKTSVKDWWEWANRRYKQYGGLVTFVDVDEKNNKYKFYFPIEDKMEVLKFLLNPSKYEETNDYIIISNLADIRRINRGYGSNHYLWILRPHVMKDPKSFTTDVEPETPTASTSTPSGESPEVEPETSEVTAENVTDEDIDTANVAPVVLDWKDFEERFAKASNWASQDPESSARVYVGGYKETYDKYIKQVPPQYLNAFNWFVKRYVEDLIFKRSRTVSQMVTGPGGITAKKAESLNRANDRFFDASVLLPSKIEKYIHKLNLREKRKAFVNSSIDERNAARIAELKKAVKRLAFLKNSASQIANGGEIPQEIAQSWRYNQRDAKTPAEARARIVAELQYDLNLDKATFKDKLTREVTKGNVEIVDAIIDYLKPLGLYTNRAEIWQFPEFARRKRQTFEAATQQAEAAAADENSNYRIEYDTQEDRVKIIFNGMPSDKAREWLKKNGFRWSPKNKAWQRQITDNARRAVEMFKESGLGKPTIHLEFENNDDLMRLFDTSDISGIEEQPAEIFNCPESMLQCQGFSPTYKILPSYDHLIDHATGQRTLVGYGFEKATLQELIDACRYYPQVAKLADHLKDPDGNELQSAFNIWHFLHTNVRYNYDAPGTEEIRVPARTWLDRYSGVDCDCLSVFTACLLICMGYRPMFEIVAFDHKPQYSHIFVNLNGAAIDRVLPAFLQRPAAITKTKIMDIPVYRLSGCNLSAVNALNGLYATTLQKLNDGTATADDSIDFRKAQILISLQGCDYNAYRLAGVLMPFVATIGDDGVYYFTNAEIARIAEQADSELRDLSANHADGDRLNGWFDTVIKKINRAASPDVATIKHTDNAPTIVVIVNPRANRVAAQGHRANVVKINPLVVLTRNCIRLLLSINYLGMASRFAVGLMSEDAAEAAGYSGATWQKAVAAVGKLRALYSQLAGDDSDITNSIIIGAQKQALYEGDYKPSQLIVETSPFDAVLSGYAEGVQIGVNGLGNGITVGSAIATVGALLPVIWGWIADVVPSTTPTTSTETAALAPAEDAEESDILPWLLLGIGGIVGGAAVISNNKKKTTKKRK